MIIDKQQLAAALLLKAKEAPSGADSFRLRALNLLTDTVDLHCTLGPLLVEAAEHFDNVGNSIAAESFYTCGHNVARNYASRQETL